MYWTTSFLIFTRYLLLYGGIGMIVLGMFGSLMVIILFSQHPLHLSPCSFYIRVAAILSFLFLPTYFLSVIMSLGLEIDWLITNSWCCKCQSSYAAFTVSSIFLLNCFVSLDRYAFTSQNPRYHWLHSLRVARWFVFCGLFISWIIFGLPVIILYDNIPNRSTDRLVTCTSTSRIFLILTAAIYFPFIEGIFPILFVIFFWYLTRKHVKSLQVEQVTMRFDRQITRTYFFQIIINAVASFPFATFNLYRAWTIEWKRTTDEENLLKIFHLLTVFLFYIQYCSDFYIFILTSSEIRTRFRQLLHFDSMCNNRVDDSDI